MFHHWKRERLVCWCVSHYTGIKWSWLTLLFPSMDSWLVRAMWSSSNKVRNNESRWESIWLWHIVNHLSSPGIKQVLDFPWVFVAQFHSFPHRHDPALFTNWSPSFSHLWSEHFNQVPQEGNVSSSKFGDTLVLTGCRVELCHLWPWDKTYGPISAK